MNFKYCQMLLAMMIVIPSFVGQSVKADTVYSITPYTLSSGFQITGGSITTDDTVGRGQTDFFASNIIDYEVVVSGPLNFTFTPSNRNARIFSLDAGVVVTETGIWVEPSDSASQELRFEARELGINALSIQQIFWGHGPIGNPVSTVGFGAGGPGEQGTFSQTPRVDRLLIAGSFSAVPEPTAMTCLMGLGLIIATRRKRLNRTSTF